MNQLNYQVLFEDVNVWAKITPDYYTMTYPLTMKKACKTYKVIARTLKSKLLDIEKRLDNRKVIFIYPIGRFFRLADIIHEKYNLFTFDNVFSKEISSKYKNVKVLSNNIIQKGIFKSFTTHKMRYAQKAFERTKKIFIHNKVQLIILGNDWTFFERLCALVGKHLKIPVVTLQHGIYHKDTIKIMEFGKYSDQFWCWSDYVKKNHELIYGEKNGFIKIVGYPHELPSDFCFIQKDKVLFIGTPYLNENKSLCFDYENMIEKVIEACDELNLKFIFRPHPGENREYYVNRFNNFKNFILSSEPSLSKDVISSGIVIGDTSSALLEANLLHRRAIQVVWSDKLGIDLYDELYDSFIKAENSKESIREAIKQNIGMYYEDDKIFY